jgi:hypothetical protein
MTVRLLSLNGSLPKPGLRRPRWRNATGNRGRCFTNLSPCERTSRDPGVMGLVGDNECGLNRGGPATGGDGWPDDVRLSDLEPRFTCQACGRRGATVRPYFGWEEEARCATPPKADYGSPGLGAVWPTFQNFWLKMKITRRGFDRFARLYVPLHK